MTPRQRYPTDLTDGQWAVLAPLIPPAKPGGRPRSVAARAIVDAILYHLRNGGTWRSLPHDYPSWKTVYHYFRAWRLDGTWERIHDTLRDQTRAAAGRAGVRMLRFLAVRAGANHLPAAWAAAAIFAGDGLGQIDAGNVRNRRQPGEHVGKLPQPLLVRAVPQRSRQLANLLDEPEECAFDAAGHVFLVVHLADESLKIGE